MNKSKFIKFTFVKFTSFLMLTNLCLTTVYAAKALNDGDLADQADHLARLTPIIISAVKEDVQQPASEQMATHDRVAKAMSDKAKQANLNAGVISVYQVQKKTIDLQPISQNTQDTKSQIPRFVTIGVSAQNNNVRIVTDDHVTIYTNPSSSTATVSH